ncbi:serine/threonine-protein kinase [Streptomyces diastaticus]|uniref:serine/threonine-protein kinase n=1 Tax=Streptomyces TaxID=1883 RepID=UPI000C25C063|nr:serine/threonine-protein kinase [Streptomyces sp. TSRI0384-2]PJM84669.1 serine/threonine protein kinase [Streptomyces sp. TSRI0384-2]
MTDAEQSQKARRDEDGARDGGRLLAGRYRLGGVLGRGGMGTVWRAEDETLGRTVAVKELRFPSSIDEEEKRRLITRTLREAKAIARIRSNGAVTVYDVVDEDDRPWIVMELIEGKSLAEVIREDGTLSPRRAAEVGLAILGVLRAAHREGILHRDVKPSNVLIEGDDGRVVLTDFGIAQVEGDPSITSTGMLVGAPSYISPERARGHKPGPAADLWSLGGLLYASVEGIPPYDKGSAIATLTAVMTEPLDPPKNAGPLSEVIYGLLAKDPAQRLDEAGARALLREVIATEEAGAGRAADATKVVPLPKPADGGARESRPKLERTPRAAGAPKAAAAATAAKSPALWPKMQASDDAPAVPPATVSPAAAPTRATATGGRPPVARASLTDVVSRRALLVALGVAVLLVATVLGFVLTRSGDSGGSDAAGGDKNASAGAGGGEGGDRAGGGKGPVQDGGKGGEVSEGGKGGEDSGEDGEDQGDDGGGKGDDAGEGSGHDPGEPGDDTLEHTAYRHSQGFRIGLPEGWKYTTTGAAGARFTGPDGQKLLVGWTGTPKDDPVADWKAQEKYMRRAQYERIHIEAVDYRGWNTADWEFTYVDGGVKYRSVDRGLVVDKSLGYGLMYTAKDAEWHSELIEGTWRTFTETFRPKK